MSYIIGLIDDNNEQISDIRATIKANNTANIPIDFKIYSIPLDSMSAIDTLFKEIIYDIRNENIHSLIIDYKIVVLTKNIDGTKLVKAIKDNLPNFPTVVLTEIPNESKEREYIDVDKVYIKKDFLKLKDAYSKEKVNNIIDSIKKYVKQKDKLKTELEEVRKKEDVESDKVNAIRSIIRIEDQLSKYIPLDVSQADRMFDKEKISEIMTVIKQANDLLEK